MRKNEAAVRRYIQEQEKEDQRLEQMNLAALTNNRFERFKLSQASGIVGSF